MEFFLGLYEFLKEDLLQGFERVKKNKKLRGFFNATFLALVDKKYNKKSLISLDLYLYAIEYIKYIRKFLSGRGAES
jgi:hypothetical protein